MSDGLGGAEEAAHVSHYHRELSALLRAQGDTAPTMAELETALALSYCDLGRWMSGWGWWGHDLEGKICAVLDRLDGGAALPSEQHYAQAMKREFPVDSSLGLGARGSDAAAVRSAAAK